MPLAAAPVGRGDYLWRRRVAAAILPPVPRAGRAEAAMPPPPRLDVAAGAL